VANPRTAPTPLDELLAASPRLKRWLSKLAAGESAASEHLAGATPINSAPPPAPADVEHSAAILPQTTRRRVGSSAPRRAAGSHTTRKAVKS
jgi:hypothetical protein